MIDEVIPNIEDRRNKLYRLNLCLKKSEELKETIACQTEKNEETLKNRREESKQLCQKL